MKYIKRQVGNSTWYQFENIYEIRINSNGLLYVKIFKGTDTTFDDLVDSLKTVCSLERSIKLQWEIVCDNKFLDCVARKVGFRVHHQFRPWHNRHSLIKVYYLKAPLL